MNSNVVDTDNLWTIRFACDFCEEIEIAKIQTKNVDLFNAWLWFVILKEIIT